MKTPLSLKKIFVFWLPLAATWWMMSAEVSFLSAVIARMPAPKFNLAAFGMAFSFALIVESPVIMMMSAATALVVDRDSYLKLKRFAWSLNILLTVLLVILLIPPVFRFITLDLIGLPKNIAKLTHIALVLLLPWPAAIGYRRFYQGILISRNRTRRVAYGTVIRLTSMVATSIILHKTNRFPGVVAGAGALSVGVMMEALATRFFVRDCLKAFKEKTTPAVSGKKPLDLRGILTFYYPLALTSVLALSSLPIVTFFMGKSRMPIESLAVLPVVNALVFMFCSPGFSFQEAAIALMGEDWSGYRALRRFASRLALGLVGIFILISTTPLATFWYREVSGLSPDLTEFAILPTIILAAMPGLVFLLSFQRAFLVNARETRPITVATFLEITTIVGVLILTIWYLKLPGAIAAAIAFLLGRITDIAALLYPTRRILMRTK